MEELVLLHERGQCLLEHLAREPRAVDDLLVVDRLQSRETSDHRQLVATESRRVDYCSLHLRVHAVEDLRRARRRSDRHVPARQRLRDGDDVRVQPVVLVRPHPSGAPEPGLHLVCDKERAVLPAEPLDARPVLVARQVDAFSLNDLDDEGGDIASPELALEALQVTEPDRVTAWQEWPEALPELLAAIKREGAVCEAVEGMVGVEHPWAPRRVPRELDGRLDRLGSRVREETPPDPLMHRSHQRLSEEARQESTVELREIRKVHVEGIV